MNHRPWPLGPLAPRPLHRPAGVILLEVVLALGLLVATGAIVIGAMTASTRTAGDVMRKATGQDRLISVFSQLQMGLLPMSDAGPTPFDPPFEDWTWQIAVEPITSNMMASTLQQVTVTVQEATHRETLTLTRWMPAADANQAALGVGP